MSGSKRILIVDDDAQVLFVLHDALKKLGGEHEIATARNGREALAKMKETPFDLVITDLRMPGLDGVSLTEEIRTSNPTAVVIWITAYSCKGLETDAARLAVHDCLEKPLEPAEIRRVAQEALESVGG
jgi:CheY-like chemotaxis protein